MSPWRSQSACCWREGDIFITRFMALMCNTIEQSTIEIAMNLKPILSFLMLQNALNYVK